jgi:hypothetical protein
MWEFCGTVQQLFIDIKTAYDSFRRQLLYIIRIEFSELIKLDRIIEMYLNDTSYKIHIGTYLCNMIHIQNDLKQGDALLPLLFNFALEYVIRKVQESQVELKLNRTHQLVIFPDNVNLMGDNITIKKNTEALIDASKEADLEAQRKHVCVDVSSPQWSQSHNIKIVTDTL